MESLKKAVNVKRKAIYGIEMLFSRLFVVGQQRSIDMANVPPALIDEYGCLRKGDKAVLVKSISVSVMTPSAPDVVLVDGGQLLYHVVWPVLGTTGDVAAGFGIRLTHYPPVSKKIVLFDRYDQEAPSAKDHERTRRGRAKEVRLIPNTPFHAEKLFSTISRTRICSTAFCAGIPFHTTFHSSTSWTVLLPMMRQTSPSAATCWKRRQKAPRLAESSVTTPTSLCSWCTGHRGCELPTYSCMCSELIFRCHYGRQWTKVTHQLLPKHSRM